MSHSRRAAANAYHPKKVLMRLHEREQSSVQVQMEVSATARTSASAPAERGLIVHSNSFGCLSIALRHQSPLKQHANRSGRT